MRKSVNRSTPAMGRKDSAAPARRTKLVKDTLALVTLFAEVEAHDVLRQIRPVGHLELRLDELLREDTSIELVSSIGARNKPLRLRYAIRTNEHRVGVGSRDGDEHPAGEVEEEGGRLSPDEGRDDLAIEVWPLDADETDVSLIPMLACRRRLAYPRRRG